MDVTDEVKNAMSGVQDLMKQLLICVSRLRFSSKGLQKHSETGKRNHMENILFLDYNLEQTTINCVHKAAT